MFHISETEKHSAELAILVAELDAFQAKLYPAESNHCLELSTIKDESIRCLIVRDQHGNPAGCGAIFLQGDGSGEIKRVYIRSEYRGQKIGEKIVGYLENLAVKSDCHLLRLETGIYQKPAIALYQNCGYEFCDPFPPYSEDPLSVFMYKNLNNPVERVIIG
ncbi:putative acetyltransferase [Erwinia toletana]|uniref:Acetyltransferase n=1 Tax=Winslowiella toletana TaxID=92490 RepID=A0ABS4PFC7_9GAMM|nr:GNAT family N-acetyltransferase [Winslowiella toletana]MBP2171353.1 putative acetyltransferase [Winslowiella toletana]